IRWRFNLGKARDIDLVAGLELARQNELRVIERRLELDGGRPRFNLRDLSARWKLLFSPDDLRHAQGNAQSGCHDSQAKSAVHRHDGNPISFSNTHRILAF